MGYRKGGGLRTPTPASQRPKMLFRALTTMHISNQRRRFNEPDHPHFYSQVTVATLSTPSGCSLGLYSSVEHTFCACSKGVA